MKKKKNRNVKNTNLKVSKRKELLYLGIILILTFILFSPALKNNFTNWDDNLYVTENNTITSISLDDLGKFGDTFAGNFHPLTMISLAIDYHFFGLDPFYYHLKNLIFHLFNVLLVFYFIKRITKNNLFIAFLTALIFAIHPMHVESVAWVAERKDVLYTFYFLIGLLAYHEYLLKRKFIYFVAAAVSFILSTLAKSAAVVFPVVLFLIDYFEGRKFTFKTILEKIPLFLISIYIGITAFSTQTKALGDFRAYSIFEKIRFASYGFMNYLVKFIYPHNFSAFHPYPEKGTAVPATYNLAIIAVLILVGYMIFKGRKMIWLVFGLGFYLVTVALVLQFITVGDAVIAERYTYVPYIGIAFVYATILHHIFWKSKNKNFKYIAGTILAVQLFFFAGKTYSRTKVWYDSASLWTDVIKKYPNESGAYTNRGHFYRTKNNYDLAFQDYNMAIKLDNKNYRAFSNRGYAYYQLKQYKNALADNERSLQIVPGNADIINTNGLCYYFLKDYDKAIAEYNRCITLNATKGVFFMNRSLAWYAKGDKTRALGDAAKAQQLGYKVNAGYINFLKQ